MYKKSLLIILGLAVASTSLSSCFMIAAKVGREVYEEIEDERHGNHHQQQQHHEEHNILPDGHRIKNALSD